MKSLIYALAVVVPLSAVPAFAAAGSDTTTDTNLPANSVSQPDDERNAPLAAQLQEAQRGVGPVFGNDSGTTPPVQGNGSVTIAPYPDSERPAFNGGP